MKITIVQRAAAFAACVGMLVPHSALAAPQTPVAKAPKVEDIALRDGGLLLGQVMDAQAKPLADTVVSLQHGGKEVARTTTDKNGIFAAKGLRGGQYRVATAGGAVDYRLWAAKTAPPNAKTATLIVSGDQVINGQVVPTGQNGHFNGGGHGPFIGWIVEHPFLAAAGIATAIAVPIAVSDDDDPAS